MILNVLTINFNLPRPQLYFTFPERVRKTALLIFLNVFIIQKILTNTEVETAKHHILEKRKANLSNVCLTSLLYIKSKTNFDILCVFFNTLKNILNIIKKTNKTNNIRKFRFPKMGSVYQIYGSVLLLVKIIFN